MQDIINVVVVILFILIIVQIIRNKAMKSKVNNQEFEARMNELMSYLDKGEVDVYDESGHNIAMIAAMSEHASLKLKRKGTSYLDVLNRALDLGSNINEVNEETGDSLLHYALIDEYNMDITKTLIKRGADTNITNKREETPLFAGVKSSMKQLDLILRKTSNLNHTNFKGDTALHEAARHCKYVSVIEELLKNGADPKIINKNNDNAYDIANMHKDRLYKQSGNSANPNQYGKHNHNVDEMVRHLYCLVNDKPYKYKKYVKPSSNNEPYDGE